MVPFPLFSKQIRVVLPAVRFPPSGFSLALLISLPLAAPAAFSAPPAGAAPTSDAAPLPLQDPRGMQRLIDSGAKADYGPLAQTFLSQTNLAFCGVASATMVLNSLPVPAPPAANLGPYRYWTQDNLLPAAAGRSPLTAPLVARRGMTLAELEQLLEAVGVPVRRLHGDQLSLAALRTLLRRSLDDPADRLVVNFDRSGLGQGRGGHISPLAAYHAPSDTVLLLDVARYRYPAAWIPVVNLWQAMRTRDPQSGRQRGLLLVNAGPSLKAPTPVQPAVMPRGRGR